jgi:hypothetical protein
VEYDYNVKRTDDDIRKLAEAERTAPRKQEEPKPFRPLEAMIGKPALPLPAEGWINGNRPDLTGKPYLLHFWEATCPLSEDEVDRLTTLAKKGTIIVGMHPYGRTQEEVEKVIKDHKLNYPTFLDRDEENEAVAYSAQKIGGYPIREFSYYILVDARGRVAGHNRSLSELLEKSPDVLIAPSQE